MKINHIGYLVENIESAAKEFKGLGFSQTGEMFEDISREAYLLFLDNGGYAVELIQPVSETSPIYELLRRYRNSPYHICYEADNLSEKIDEMLSTPWRKGGYILISPPSPAPAMLGCPNVAFLMNRNIGMIELVQKQVL